jgi:hypothetical protein
VSFLATSTRLLHIRAGEASFEACVNASTVLGSGVEVHQSANHLSSLPPPLCVLTLWVMWGIAEVLARPSHFPPSPPSFSLPVSLAHDI